MANRKSKEERMKENDQQIKRSLIIAAIGALILLILKLPQ